MYQTILHDVQPNSLILLMKVFQFKFFKTKKGNQKSSFMIKVLLLCFPRLLIVISL